MHNDLDVTDDICRSAFQDLSSMTFGELSNFTFNEIGNINTIIKIINQRQKTCSRPMPQNIQITDINNAYNKKNLVLVLGAGVSEGCGLPDWDNLLRKLQNNINFNRNDVENQSLLIGKIFFKLFSRSELILARNLHLHCRFGSENEDNIIFEKFVRCALYEGTKMRFTKLLAEIIRLCSFLGGEKFLDSIITYNYDDVLEHFLEQNETNTPYEPIYYSEEEYINVGRLPVYHVHGFLPRKGNLTDKNKIILGEETYHSLYNSTQVWNNKIQLEKFKNKKCLLIGLSLNDPNLRRLLDAANKERNNNEYHHIIALRPKLAKYSKNLKKLLEEDGNILDEKISNNLEFKETVEMLRETEENFFEDDALSLGVQTIWAEDEADISKKLQQIAKYT